MSITKMSVALGGEGAKNPAKRRFAPMTPDSAPIMVDSVPIMPESAPILSRSQFEEEALEFHIAYCAEALERPMPVPIRKIIRNQMKLNILKGHHLSRDLSIFGMLCYSPGEVTVYNNKYEPVSVSLDSPAVFIESEVYFRSDISCESITLAHEAYHWHKHRAYALTQSLHSGRKPRGSRDRDGRGRGREPIADSGRDGSGGGGEPIAGIGSDGWGGGGKSIVSRCAVEPSGSRISDIMQPNEDWMEWQANRVAPKILMPLNTVKRKAADLAGFFHYTNNSRNSRDSQKIMEYIIDEIAEVYKVTREAARIRMVEIGYEEAARVYRPQTVE